MSYKDHQKAAAALGPIGCAVVTVSDTRTEQDDRGGALIRQLLATAGHRVVRYVVLKDEPDAIRAMMVELAADPACSAILLSGGTGVSTRDRTYEAVTGLLEKRIDGFGELFRYLSFAEIGSGAMLSRAVGGVYRGRAVFAMPGSPAAVELAVTRLILPELAHLVFELRR